MSYLSCAKASAYDISGRVVDVNGHSIPDVHLFLNTSRRSTITNSNGGFFIRSSIKNDTLSISHIGYETQTIPIKQDMLDLCIRLIPSYVQLDEIVVTNLSAHELLQKAIEKIPQNYSQNKFLTKLFYRAKLNALTNDSLLYVEEAAIEQIKSYKRHEKDKTFLLRNRNFSFDTKQRRISGVGLFDYVKIWGDNNPKYSKFPMSYGAFSSYDNRGVYVIELNKEEENSERLSGRFYIDTEDLAFVRIELSNGKKHHIEQYKKIDSLYFLTYTHLYNIDRRLNSRVKVSAEWVLTEIKQPFYPEDINGFFVRDEENEILHSTPLYANDTLFWQDHNQTLPDEYIKRKITANRKTITDDATMSASRSDRYKRLYTPHLTLAVSTQIPNDFYALARTATSVNQLSNYAIQNKIGNLFIGLTLSTVTNYFFITPLEDIAIEQQLLSGKGIKMRYHPFAFNSFGRSYHYGASVSQINRFKRENYTDFVRLHTIRSEYRYVKARMQEEEIVHINTRNRNNLLDYFRYYSFDLLYNRMHSISWTPLKDIVVEKHNESEMPLIVDINKSWVKNLFEPETPFSAHITRSSLSDEEQHYLRRSSYLSWLNLFSLPLFGVSRVSLGRDWQGSFSLGYLRTPFGEQMEQNVWLSYKNQLHGLFVRQYMNHEKTGWGVGYKLYDVKVNRNLYLTSEIDYWLQPKNMRFYDHSFKSGFHLGQEVQYHLLYNPYTKQNRLSLSLGYDFKTHGYMPGNLHIGSHFKVNVGLRLNF